MWSVAGVAVTTVLSVILFVSGLSATVHNSPPQVDELLLRPNPYVYLDKILRNTTMTFPPIINFPQVVLQIDNADGSRTMREDERGRATTFGTVYPDDRRILISDNVSSRTFMEPEPSLTVSTKVSTIVQFRNLDYAMESCILNFSVPVETAGFHPDVSLAPSSIIDVWTLADSGELAQDIRGRDILARAPARRTLLATLPFPASGSQQSKAFHCPSGAFTALELVCSHTAPACRVDFWQDRRAKPVGGEYLSPRSDPMLFV